MPRYNLQQNVIDLTTGKNFQRQVKLDYTVKDAIVEALCVYQPHLPIDLTEKKLRGELAERLTHSKNPDLNEDEIRLIEKAAGEYCAVPFMHAIAKALEAPLVTIQ